jgi:predicted acylesterase/phospholipase RssA
MGKLNIKDLEYLVLEGGGAKGVVYLGAIEALEERLEAAFKKGDLKKRVVLVEDGFEKNTYLSHKEYLDLKKGLYYQESILDYYPKNFTFSDNKVYQPRIKGIAGSSAGAITSFALTLGLNSADITKVMEYSFTNFLSEKDIGKYRMVNSKNEIKVGQDDKKILGGVEEDFKFQNSNYFDAKSNLKKAVARQFVVGGIAETIVDGAFNKVRTIIQMGTQRRLRDMVDHWAWRALFIKIQDHTYAERSGLYQTLNKVVIFKTLQLVLTKWWFRKKINKPLTLDFDTIGNLIWDRGFFSGFSVREFFYEMMIFAATRDTHFQRGLISEGKLKIEIAKQLRRDFSSFAFGKRDENSYLDKVDLELLKYIQNITFAEFYKLTKIDFAVGVTNHSTGQPLIFSNKYTPNYLVMEAVAASMTIPPAIKPLYNEGIVLNPKGYDFQKISVNIGGVQCPISDAISSKKSANNFNLANYQLAELAVKKYLSKQHGDYFNTNNTINTMLPLLKKAIDFELSLTSPSSDTSKTIEIGDQKIIVDLHLLIYFYNVCYFGLLVDGGALCNIPYNYFRKEKTSETVDTLDGILALKLDGSVPEEMQIEFNQFLDQMLSKTGLDKKLLKRAIKRHFNYEKLKEGTEPLLKNFMNQFGPNNEIIDSSRRQELLFIAEAIEKKAEKLFFKEIPSGLKNKEKKVIKESLKKVVLELVEKYCLDTSIPPWKRQKPITNLISTLQYGAEDGQIRYLSDHNHIIPLYSYGVNTFDFDIEKFKDLIEVSNLNSKKAVNEFFAHKNI